MAAPDRATLIGLGTRNVQFILLDASCLRSIGFRNELVLRIRQPRLSSIPLLLYGPDAPVAAGGLVLEHVRTATVGNEAGTDGESLARLLADHL